MAFCGHADTHFQQPVQFFEENDGHMFDFLIMNFILFL